MSKSYFSPTPGASNHRLIRRKLAQGPSGYDDDIDDDDDGDIDDDDGDIDDDDDDDDNDGGGGGGGGSRHVICDDSELDICDDIGKKFNISIKWGTSATLNVFVWMWTGSLCGMEYLLEIFGAISSSPSRLQTLLNEMIKEPNSAKKRDIAKRIRGHFGACT